MERCPPEARTVNQSNQRQTMAKEDVLDTVDIFFGAGKSASEPEARQQLNDTPPGGKGGVRRRESEPAATGTTIKTEPEPNPLPDRERISFVLPTEQVEFLKNYKYCRALMDGDPQYTLTEALIEAIELLRKHSAYEVFERPDFVRAREKKPRKR